MSFYLWFKKGEISRLWTIVFMALILLIPVALTFYAWQQPKLQTVAGNNLESPSRGTSISRDELTLIARVIEGEAANETYQGKVAVGAVILNRLESPEFPASIPGIIYEPDAFEAVTNGQYKRPLTKESLQAARDAINGKDPTNGCLYYWNPAKATSTWVWSRPIVTRIDHHVFAK